MSNTRISELECSFDPRVTGDSDDEPVFTKPFRFFDEKYLRQCCKPGADCLASERCIPIGTADGGDEFVYLWDDVLGRVAFLHHDDVYLARDIDAVFADKAARLETALVLFVECLIPRTNLAKFSGCADTSKWLIVEQIGSMVRYEIEVDEDGKADTQHFESPAEAEAFFFDTIRQSQEITALAILDCLPRVRDRIEALIGSSD